MMIAGCNNYIKVWEFSFGLLSFLETLDAHKYTVTNLLFSKFKNNFISGSKAGDLICWK